LEMEWSVCEKIVKLKPAHNKRYKKLPEKVKARFNFYVA